MAPVTDSPTRDLVELLRKRGAERRVRTGLHSEVYGVQCSQHAVLPDLDIQAIRIDADSLVVIHWITGEYCIRNPRMKGLINDITWSIWTIREENNDIPMTIQWTKSHEGIESNEYVDTMLELRNVNGK